MKLSTTTIKSFMDEHNKSYPYNAIPCTHQDYHTKWLLATTRNCKGLVLRKEGYHAIKTSCLSHGNVQQLIMAHDGIPLPAEFCEAVDGLETCGGVHWTCWLEKSLKLMYECMREDNVCGGVGSTKMRLFHDCILLGVQWKAGCKCYTNSAECNLVLSNWNTYFWVRCRETYSFHELCCGSMNNVAGMIESIERDGAFESQSMCQWASCATYGRDPCTLLHEWLSTDSARSQTMQRH